MSPESPLCRPCCPSFPVTCSVPQLLPCHLQSSPVKMMSFFLLSLIQQFGHKKLFILPAPLPFSCAKPPQNLISGALQLQFHVSPASLPVTISESSKLFTYLPGTHAWGSSGSAAQGAFEIRGRAASIFHVTPPSFICCCK